MKRFSVALPRSVGNSEGETVTYSEFNILIEPLPAAESAGIRAEVTLTFISCEESKNINDRL